MKNIFDDKFNMLDFRQCYCAKIKEDLFDEKITYDEYSNICFQLNHSVETDQATYSKYIFSKKDRKIKELEQRNMELQALLSQVMKERDDFENRLTQIKAFVP